MSSFIGIKTGIKHETNTLEKEAIEVFQKDKTESLLALFSSNNHSIKEKNKAIWVLGVLKSKNALPMLETLSTGEECNHGSDICQHEIKKAIKKIKGGKES